MIVPPQPIFGIKINASTGHPTLVCTPLTENRDIAKSLSGLLSHVSLVPAWEKFAELFKIKSLKLFGYMSQQFPEIVGPNLRGPMIFVKVNVDGEKEEGEEGEVEKKQEIGLEDKEEEVEGFGLGERTEKEVSNSFSVPFTQRECSLIRSYLLTQKVKFQLKEALQNPVDNMGRILYVQHLKQQLFLSMVQKTFHSLNPQFENSLNQFACGYQIDLDGTFAPAQWRKSTPLPFEWNRVRTMELPDPLHFINLVVFTKAEEGVHVLGFKGKALVFGQQAERLASLTFVQRVMLQSTVEWRRFLLFRTA